MATPTLWPVPPDWNNGVRESLAWLTEILQAPMTGTAQHRRLRIAPRRRFVFDVIASGQERRIADALLADRGGAQWLLPIWPDIQCLSAPVAAGAVQIPCRTAGFDFAVGSPALLWTGVRTWEIVQVQSVQATHLALVNPLQVAWPRGARLYPLRLARLDDAQDKSWTDGAGTSAISFAIDEPCDWPAELPASAYLGRPVLEDRPDWADDVPMSYARITDQVDAETGPIARFDLAGVSLRSTSHARQIWGRTEHAVFRSRLYALQGRGVPVWVPSWRNDLRVVAPISAAATAITVEYAGYTQYGRQQPNRRDIRIQLVDGRVFYRRITASAELGDNETLGIDQPLGVAVNRGQVMLVSYLVLSTLASDEIEIFHVTDADGAATAQLPFQAVVPDV